MEYGPLCLETLKKIKHEYKKEELTKFGHIETHAQRHLKFKRNPIDFKILLIKGSDVKYYLCHKNYMVKVNSKIKM